MKLLNVTGQRIYDTKIQKYKFHNYKPYITGKINYNDEFRISIQHLDSYILPCKGYLDNADWYLETQTTKGGVTEHKSIIVDKDGNFHVCIPLQLLSSFLEDFSRPVVNMLQTLVLVCTSNDKEVVISTDEIEEPKIEIKKLTWFVPHIIPSVQEQILLKKIIS